MCIERRGFSSKSHHGPAFTIPLVRRGRNATASSTAAQASRPHPNRVQGRGGDGIDAHHIPASSPARHMQTGVRVQELSHSANAPPQPASDPAQPHAFMFLCLPSSLSRCSTTCQLVGCLIIKGNYAEDMPLQPVSESSPPIMHAGGCHHVPQPDIPVLSMLRGNRRAQAAAELLLTLIFSPSARPDLPLTQGASPRYQQAPLSAPLNTMVMSKIAQVEAHALPG